jgi:hypothetical protein
MGAAPPQPERRELSGGDEAGRRSRLPERRLLQALVAVGCLVPLAAGGAGILRGAAFLKNVHDPLPVDLGSHFRYLSGLLMGIGIGFAICIPGIERRGTMIRTLGLIVVVGGLGRLFALLRDGPPSAVHLGALAMELIATPILVLWQARVARLSGIRR